MSPGSLKEAAINSIRPLFEKLNQPNSFIKIRHKTVIYVCLLHVLINSLPLFVGLLILNSCYTQNLRNLCQTRVTSCKLRTRVKLVSNSTQNLRTRVISWTQIFYFPWTQTLKWSEKLCSNSWLKSDLKTLNSTQNAIPWLKNCVQNTVFFLNEQSSKKLVLTIFLCLQKNSAKNSKN